MPKYWKDDEDINRMLLGSKINDTESYKTVKCYDMLKNIGNSSIGFLE